MSTLIMRFLKTKRSTMNVFQVVRGRGRRIQETVQRVAVFQHDSMTHLSVRRLRAISHGRVLEHGCISIAFFNSKPRHFCIVTEEVNERSQSQCFQFTLTHRFFQRRIKAMPMQKKTKSCQPRAKAEHRQDPAENLVYCFYLCETSFCSHRCGLTLQNLGTYQTKRLLCRQRMLLSIMFIKG